MSGATRTVWSIWPFTPVHVSAGVLEQLVVRVEDDDRDLTVAEDGQLVGFLHQTELALGESDLSVSFVGNPLYGNLFPPHPAVCSVSLWGGAGGGRRCWYALETRKEWREVEAGALPSPLEARGWRWREEVEGGGGGR